MKNKKDIFIAFIITALMVLGSIEEPIPTEATKETDDIIHWKQEESIEDVEIEPVVIESVEEPVDEVTFYDVPLSEELQIHIFEECEKHNISPSIVIAMIERESDYTADAIGDNGKSFGLMQIQKHYHQERMNRLGCTDLLDPFQNVTVGIDILAELIEKNSDLYWVLMAYNGGQSYANRNMNSGIYSDYAIEVVARASELEKAVQYVH